MRLDGLLEYAVVLTVELSGAISWQHRNVKSARTVEDPPMVMGMSSTHSTGSSFQRYLEVARSGMRQGFEVVDGFSDPEVLLKASSLVESTRSILSISRIKLDPVATA